MLSIWQDLIWNSLPFCPPGLFPKTQCIVELDRSGLPSRTCSQVASALRFLVCSSAISVSCRAIPLRRESGCTATLAIMYIFFLNRYGIKLTLPTIDPDSSQTYPESGMEVPSTALEAQCKKRLSFPARRNCWIKRCPSASIEPEKQVSTRSATRGRSRMILRARSWGVSLKNGWVMADMRTIISQYQTLKFYFLQTSIRTYRVFIVSK